MTEPRRFPPPWSVVDQPESFTITDTSGQTLVYSYHEDEPARRDAMKRLTRDEARQIALGMARLHELIPRRRRG